MHRRTRATLGMATVLGLAAAGLTAATAAQVGFTTDKSAGLAAQINPAKPRNVILLIGDGTDDSIITAARNYELGAAGRFALDDLPFTGAMTTYGLKTGPGPVYPINYVSDSAPTASGWSTGKKTVDGRVSQGPSSADTVPGTDYETVLETFKKQGKRTGNVSTAAITDATPAAAASHINARACQGPTDMAACQSARKINGGKGSIAEQLVDNKIDVILGGGVTRFNQPTDAGPSAVAYAQSANGYRVVNDKTALAGLSSLTGGPVLGLFAPENMVPRYQPLVATAAGAGGNTTKCLPSNRLEQPTLAEMTSKAISLLDNPNGFFLQVESAMVDKQEHASDVCGAIGDVLELDNAVKVAQAYQATHPDTQIIVTGDHAHSTQIVPNGPNGAVTGATGAQGGKATATVLTADGDPMTIGYSTAMPNMVGPPPVSTSQTHTGAQIRVAASGPQAANVTGTIDQTDLYATMLGRTPSTLPGNPTTPGTPPASRPGLALAAAPSISRRDLRRGVPVSVSASAASTITVQLVSKGRTLRTRTVTGAGDKLRLKTRKPVTGALQVLATATGPGGTSTSKTRVTLTR